jgi:hypothetical protein
MTGCVRRGAFAAARSRALTREAELPGSSPEPRHGGVMGTPGRPLLVYRAGDPPRSGQPHADAKTWEGHETDVPPVMTGQVLGAVLPGCSEPRNTA